MPRFYIDTFDSVTVLDDQGVELPSREALHREVHQTLARMMHDEKDGRASIHLRADVRDEGGGRIMTATLLMVIDATD